MTTDDGSDSQPAATPLRGELVAPDRALALSPDPLGPKDVLRHFLSGRNPNTLSAYRRDLRTFAAWRDEPTVELAMARFLREGAQQAHSVALSWMAEMREAGLSSATRARRLAALRSFVTMAAQLGVIQWALTLRGPKVAKFRDTTGPSVETLRRVLGECGDGLVGKRNRALVLVIFVLGLRRAEAARLSVADYDRQALRLRIFGKGTDDQAVWMTLPDEVATALDVWLCESRKIGCDGSSVDVDPSTPVFIALDRPGREALSPSGVYHIVRTLGDRVGMRLRPHGLRHAAVTAVLDENGGNVRMAQVFARHANPSVTMTYDDQRRDLAGEASRLAARRLLGE